MNRVEDDQCPASATAAGLPAGRWAGLRVRETDWATLAAWAETRVRALALPDRSAYERLLEDDATGAQERELLSVRFSSSETYFFRDTGQFSLLASTILPDLIRRRRSDRRLRLWSAGCASGEEAYSLAMLVREAGPALDGWEISILGTDINAEALAKARAGRFRPWSFRTLDEARRQRYFTATGDEWQIDERLRAMVEFRQLDLARLPSPEAASDLAGFDLIVCRNVFIYLTAPVVARIAAGFGRALADGGYLMTGHTELFGHTLGPLRTRIFPESIVFHKDAAWKPDAPEPLAPLVPPAVTVQPAARVRSPAKRHAAVPPGGDSGNSAAAIEQVLGAAWDAANRGEPAPARRAAEALCATTVFDPRPYYLLAQLDIESGDLESARTRLKKVLYLDPGFVAAMLDLAALGEQTADSAAARRYYRGARRTLTKLPPSTPIAACGDSPAGEILGFVERRLADLESPAGVTTANPQHPPEPDNV